jgi:SAM-dependent methyltransferase
MYINIYKDKFNVNSYDSLRVVSNDTFSAVAEFIIKIAQNYTSDFSLAELGVGSGRFLIPVILRSLNVLPEIKFYAVDSSTVMLEVFKRRIIKLSEKKRKPQINIIKHDIQLPFSFVKKLNVSYVIAVLHILNNWRSTIKNIYDATTTGGTFICFQEYNQFMHQTETMDRNGDFKIIDHSLNDFMQYYHTLREKYKCRYEPHEVMYSDMSRIFEFAEVIGFKRIKVEYKKEDFKWQKPHSFREIMLCFKNKQMTTWGSELNDDLRSKIYTKLDNWLTVKNIDKDEVFYLPAEIIPNVFIKDQSFSAE